MLFHVTCTFKNSDEESAPQEALAYRGSLS